MPEKTKRAKPGPGGRTLDRPQAVKPQIKLYLEKINQEMIRFTPEAAGCDFYAQWSKSCCILDFSIVKPGDLVTNPARGLLIRQEGEGGMMWNPRTGAVYKLNETAYHAILDLESGLSEHEIARRNDLDLPTVKSMVARLRKIAA